MSGVYIEGITIAPAWSANVQSGCLEGNAFWRVVLCKLAILFVGGLLKGLGIT